MSSDETMINVRTTGGREVGFALAGADTETLDVSLKDEPWPSVNTESLDVSLPVAGNIGRVSQMDQATLSKVLTHRSAKMSDNDVGGESKGVLIREKDYQALMRNMGHKESAASRMKKLALLLVFLIVVLAGVSLATSITAAELAKESHIKGAAMVDKNNIPIMTASGDLDVCNDSSLAQKGMCAVDSKGRRLQDVTASSDDSTLKTISMKQKRTLASSLSDAYFLSLEDVVVYSDKGHSLRFQVHGFARVPVLNSRCGNIVHLYTAWNGRLTLDSSDLSFDPETEAHFKNAGFSLAVGGVSGRRLASKASVDGFFAAVQGVEGEEWTCTDVPLPKMPTTSTQDLTVFRPCAVSGTTGSTMDMCDSMYGGVVPGVAWLSTDHQLATMTKTARIRAKLSVDVTISQTMFIAESIQIIKSPSYELQISTLPNHPGQKKVNIFDRRTSADVSFQLITGMETDGRFYCNSTGANEETPQKSDLEAEKAGMDRQVHFEFLDMMEEGGVMYRHFRMMPSEAFVEWMGGHAEADRPRDAYYEYWDSAEDLTPYRLLLPDGGLAIFNSMSKEATDAEVEAKLTTLGQAGWASTMSCSAEEKKFEEVMSATLAIAVPMAASPMMDLNSEALSFYAKLHLDPQVEPSTGNGWETFIKAAEGTGGMANFAKYALSSMSPTAMPDICSDACSSFLMALQRELESTANLELCDATNLESVVLCMAESSRPAVCAKSSFMLAISEDCMGAEDNTTAVPEGRLLGTNEDKMEDSLYEDGELDDEDEQAGETFVKHMRKIALHKKATKMQQLGETKKAKMTKLADGTFAINIDQLEQSQQVDMAKAMGIRRLSSGRILFNATDDDANQTVPAVLNSHDGAGTVHSRRLMMDMKCLAPNVGWGCVFSIGYPWGCDPLAAHTGGKPCSFGMAVKVQMGGPYNGALTVSGVGCIEEWAFGVPKPFKGSVCIDGGLTMSFAQTCGLPFSIQGWVGITAAVGLDLILFSFNLASIRVEAGAAIENYHYNCDDRRRRRRGWWGRRRGRDNTCQTACDIKVYAKVTFSFLIGRLWGLAQYWVRHKKFDFIFGADIYIWAVFTSWWQNVAKAQII